MNITDIKDKTKAAYNTKNRLQSLDALRGFDMFWIISAEVIIHGMAKATNLPFFNWMSGQLHHTPWNGFTFYDMIFPLFIFIAGVSMPFSFGNQFEKNPFNKLLVKKKIYRSLIKRTIILILLGMIVNGAQNFNSYENTRFASVLGRIALSCFFAALIYLNTNLRSQVIFFFSLLIGYWAALTLIPVPGFGAGVLTPEGNLPAYIDRMFLPGQVLRKVYDPEGILSTIPAIATAMLGVFVGRFLRYSSDKINKLRKGLILTIVGIALVFIGLLWNLVFPINKNMWTSSFVLYAGGWSILLLSIFYLVIDVWEIRKWSMPLVWIGMNSILIYMASHGVINFESSSKFLFGGLISLVPEVWQLMWLWVGVALIQFLLLYFLFKKKLFWKI
jgi:predicted acyltransferase